ncbi:MAG: T9SS type A sorting domain-containing protein, partial [Bacteroidota bacterium]|nr:T9SS type A sorting domain-containing protein [Bacteroidota bacterium]
VSDSVEALPQSAAKPDNSGGGGYYNSYTPHYLVFDCFAPVTLTSVKVYANSAGNRTILLRNSAGTVLETITVNIPAGEQTINLNFELPVASDLELVGPPVPDLYRNNAGLNYPYDLSGILSVKYCSASSNPTGYYYYFYNWQVKEADCISPRTKVTATIYNGVPVPGFSYFQNANTVEFTNTSGNALSYLWDFGDGTTSTEENPVHQYQSIGTFTVSLIAANVCGTDSFEVDIDILVTVAENIELINRFIVYPNPASSSFFVDIDIVSTRQVQINIFDVAGNMVRQNRLSSVSGELKKKIEVSGIKTGIYFVRIESDLFSATQKVIIIYDK